MFKAEMKITEDSSIIQMNFNSHEGKEFDYFTQPFQLTNCVTETENAKPRTCAKSFEKPVSNGGEPHTQNVVGKLPKMREAKEEAREAKEGWRKPRLQLQPVQFHKD